MKKNVKRLAAGMISCLLLTATVTVAPPSPVLIEANAHSGRTDSSGGHRDNQNKSGLGSYHYHCGGHSAHLHPNGVCPYSATTTTEVKPTAVETTAAETKAAEKKEVTGSWQKNDKGWWYQMSDDTYYADGFAKIDGKDYYFNAEGYMVTGKITINGVTYQFGDDGALVK